MDYPFKHNGPVFLVSDDAYDVAYYSLNYCKYKRVRDVKFQDWKDTVEEPVDNDVFWMVARCLERARMRRRGRG